MFCCYQPVPSLGRVVIIGSLYAEICDDCAKTVSRQKNTTKRASKFKCLKGNSASCFLNTQVYTSCKVYNSVTFQTMTLLNFLF